MHTVPGSPLPSSCFFHVFKAYTFDPITPSRARFNLQLRCGYIFPNHFLSGLSSAGLNKYLSSSELQALCDAYISKKGPSLEQVNSIFTNLCFLPLTTHAPFFSPPKTLPKHLHFLRPSSPLSTAQVHYRAFCHDVDLVFTHPELEKNPLDDVPREPSELLDKERFRRSSRMLTLEEEARLEEVLARINGICERRGMLVKPFFDDAARNRNSSCLVGHVTIGQFKQTLDVSLALGLSTDEVDLIVKKYKAEDYPEMANYLAFAATIDPPEPTYSPYRD